MSLFRLFNRGGAQGVDPDAQAFIDACGTTDQDHIDAIDALVKGMKCDGVWDKVDRAYSFLEGTDATCHKFNLKDPQDTDAAGRLVFSGNWVFSDNGVESDGSTAFANTFWDADADASINSAHIGTYLRINNEVGTNIWGSSNDLASDLFFRHDISASTYILGNIVGESYNPAPGNGMSMGSRTSSTNLCAYFNGSEIGCTTNAVTAMPTGNVYIGAENRDGVASFHAANEFAFVTLGQGLTTTEAICYSLRIIAFQTALGRNV